MRCFNKTHVVITALLQVLRALHGEIEDIITMKDMKIMKGRDKSNKVLGYAIEEFQAQKMFGL